MPPGERPARRWARQAQAWLFAPGDPRRLAALRIGLGGVLAVRLAFGPYLELSRQPAALFRPISFLKLLPHMPPPWLVVPLQLVATAAALLATVGWRPRLTLPLAWATALPLVAMTSSLGKTVHNDVLLFDCLVPLLAAPTGDAWSPGARHRERDRERSRERRGGYGWPLRVAMVVVAGAYFFSGFGKLLHAGVAWVTSGNLRWVLYAASDAQGRPNPFALGVAGRPWLAHLLAAGTIAVELCFPLVLWRPRLARLLVPAVVAMHAGIWLAMRLDYWPMAATVLIVFVDWPALADRRGRAALAVAGEAGEAGRPPARLSLSGGGRASSSAGHAAGRGGWRRGWPRMVRRS